MKVFRLDEENAYVAVGRKCVVCRFQCRVGQTIVYVPRRQVIFHRVCLGNFLVSSYFELPKQPDEFAGHELFAETREQAAQREFEDYRRKLLAEHQGIG